MTNEQVNKLLAQIDETSTVFTQKEVVFDSVITIAGQRIVGDKSERLKMKLFYFGSHCRGYYNLSELDDKNLQFFGQKIDGYWTLKCVTKLNMTEVDGYIILGENYNGLWSNGNVNFEQGTITLVKQNIDYTELKNW